MPFFFPPALDTYRQQPPLGGAEDAFNPGGLAASLPFNVWWQRRRQRDVFDESGPALFQPA